MTAIALPLAALASLGYAAWAVFMRRTIFADIAAGDSVSMDEAESSDSMDELLVWIAIVAVAVALVCWLLTRLLGRYPFKATGFAGLAMVGVGGLVAGGGAYLTSLVGNDPDEAGKAVTGYLVMGGGFLLVAIGLIVGMLSLFLGRHDDEELEELTIPGWTR